MTSTFRHDIISTKPGAPKAHTSCQPRSIMLFITIVYRQTSSIMETHGLLYISSRDRYQICFHFLPPVRVDTQRNEMEPQHLFRSMTCPRIRRFTICFSSLWPVIRICNWTGQPSVCTCDSKARPVKDKR